MKKTFWTSIAFHILLFLLTFFTTTIAGVFWINKDPFELANFIYGLPYSISLLFILSCHEFGHYFAARAHNVDATLPYYIPFPMLPSLMGILFLNFGTFGAVIRTRSVVPSRKALLDIGAAGPIAGFLASTAVLIYGFINLPGPEYILSIHPDYDFSINASQHVHGVSLAFGYNLLYKGTEMLFSQSHQFIPPMSEIYHYPFLCVGWIGLFVTALNLIPMGQFDGGHIIYAMFGKKHFIIAKSVSIILILLSVPTIIDSIIRAIVAISTNEDIGPVIPLVDYSWSGWLLWALIAIYVMKLHHPPVPDETELDSCRRIIGWCTIVIFILSFTVNPFFIE